MGIGGKEMEYFELIEKRFSARSYKPDNVEKEKLDKILRAAVLAPTACNFQAFKVFVIAVKGREEELRKIFPFKWVLEAPYLICVCSIPQRGWTRSDGKKYSDVDAAIVMDHIILAATDQGLGTCWIGAFDKTAAREALGLDGTMEPVAFTPLGYARKEAPAKVRKSMEELVVFQ